MFEIGLIFSFD